ncbi:MAG: glycosyltransferase, partial [Selenomonas sp.]|nr:glycosyltransferase [Selenomonas sp.]
MESNEKMRLAGILDPLSLECYRPECQLLELTPLGWKRELEEFAPELVFIEAAWHGKDDLWKERLDRYSPEIAGIATHCRSRGIPLVFWGKEDPVHMHRFLPTAYWADVVFTTAAECIGTYKKLLGAHRQVYHLHFAAQPRLHNPIESFGRLDRCCFAGAYYADFPDRCRVFEELAGYLSESKGLDIYDRFVGKASPLNIFPEKFQPYILGHLAPADIGRAYKGYIYNLNLNSITDSQTMFSRRVFELMASNTVVISNKSSGMENYFGRSIISADNAEELREKLASCCDTEEKLARFRLRALRQVLREHLYKDRLNFIASKVFRCRPEKRMPLVRVYAKADTQEEADRVIRMFEKQTYRAKKLVLLHNDAVWDKEENGNGSGCDYAAYFHSEDWYGENYLLDLMLIARLQDFDAIGKGAYFEGQGKDAVLRESGREYHYTRSLPARRCIFKPGMAAGKCLAADMECRDGKVLSVDPFNYCQDWQD